MYFQNRLLPKCLENTQSSCSYERWKLDELVYRQNSWVQQIHIIRSTKQEFFRTLMICRLSCIYTLLGIMHPNMPLMNLTSKNSKPKHLKIYPSTHFDFISVGVNFSYYHKSKGVVCNVSFTCGLNSFRVKCQQAPLSLKAAVIKTKKSEKTLCSLSLYLVFPSPWEKVEKKKPTSISAI